jgi:hypothetical protein
MGSGHGGSSRSDGQRRRIFQRWTICASWTRSAARAVCCLHIRQDVKWRRNQKKRQAIQAATVCAGCLFFLLRYSVGLFFIIVLYHAHAREKLIFAWVVSRETRARTRARAHARGADDQ